MMIIAPGGGASENGHAVGSQQTTSPIDQAWAHLEVFDASATSGKRIRPVIAPPGEQPDTHGVPPGHEPVAVVLDLMQPGVSAGRPWGLGGQARRDETGRQGGVRHGQLRHPAEVIEPQPECYT
jgi:hypothetical protein